MSRFTEWCDKCGVRVRLSRLSSVEVCKQTHSSPAEYEQWCDTCCERTAQRNDPHERAAARARSNDFERTNGRDWT